MENQRVAVVTGAARGIGAATATRLARDGFAVAVLDLDEAACEAVADAIRAEGGTALGLGVDVTDAEQVESGVARVADELGPPVVLVNNAGIIRDNLIFKMTEGDWDGPEANCRSVMNSIFSPAKFRASYARSRTRSHSGL